MDHKEKPGTPGDVLHSGVKGMRWGHRKVEDSGGDNGAKSDTPSRDSGGKIIPKMKDFGEATSLADHNQHTKMYMAAKVPKPRNYEEAKANFDASQKKFQQKLAPDGPVKSDSGLITKTGLEKKEPRLTPGQKKALLYAGGTVAVIGGAYLAKRYATGKLDDMGINYKPVKDFHPDELRRKAGKPIAADEFRQLVGFSQGKTWGESHLTDKAFAREAFELPAGHTFFRLSTAHETDFGTSGGGTFATHSIEDFNRYVAGFRGEKFGAQLHRVTWQTTEPTKVPNVTTVLDTLHGLMERGMPHGMDPKVREEALSPERVKETFQGMSGTNFSSPHGQKLIDALKGKGYGAIVDEMDAGVIGETPLVFFNQEHATPKTSIPMDKLSIRQAEAMLKEISIPPGRKP